MLSCNWGGGLEAQEGWSCSRQSGIEHLLLLGHFIVPCVVVSMIHRPQSSALVGPPSFLVRLDGELDEASWAWGGYGQNSCATLARHAWTAEGWEVTSCPLSGSEIPHNIAIVSL